MEYSHGAVVLSSTTADFADTKLSTVEYASVWIFHAGLALEELRLCKRLYMTLVAVHYVPLNSKDRWGKSDDVLYSVALEPAS